VTTAVEIGPVRAERGEKAFGFLPVATGADGGEIGIPVHILAGQQPGPKLVVMSSAHGYEMRQISVIQSLLETVDPATLKGDLVLIPVANPVSFEMGTRGTWIDALWGDSGNMNRMWPGRPNGWLTERFCHAIAANVLPGAAAGIDLHGHTNELAIAYGYLGEGQKGDLDYEISRSFGHELLVYASPEEKAEKRQTTGTSKAYLRSVGIAAYSCEIGEFSGLQQERESRPEADLKRTVPEVGVTGVTNVMKLMGMIDGEIKRPTMQIKVQPELNLRPNHGGLLVSNFGAEAIGTIIPKGTPLGTLISPYSLKEIETIVAPFDESLLLATLPQKPFTKVNPGDYAFIVADNSKTEILD
jgi:predicted deacylase